MSRIVFHLDMDAFFASVEERDHPEFRGMPVIVGADPKAGKGRGVVATANYEARKYGVGSAMPISRAWELCQEGERKGGKRCVWFGGGHGKYTHESRRVMRAMLPHVSQLEQVGLDEAYFEIRQEAGGRRQQWAQAEAAGRRIKDAIRKETGLTASIGIGPNKLVAKIASDMDKPDGLTVVTPEAVQDVLDPLPLRRIPGIGPKAATLLASRGAKTVKDARRFTEHELLRWFGKWGSGMHQRVRGIDERPLEVIRERKSLGHETTFMEDEDDPKVLVETVKLLAEQVAWEVGERGVLARRITLRIRFSDFKTLTRQVTLDQPSDDARVFEREALKLLMPFLDKRENPLSKSFRLLGVRAGRLTVEQGLGL